MRRLNDETAEENCVPSFPLVTLGDFYAIVLFIYFFLVAGNAH